MIKIILADDHPIIRDGMKVVLESQTDFNIIEVANDGEEAFNLVKEKMPDILLTDITMPKMNGLELALKLKEMGSATKVIILSMHDTEAYIKQAIENGAKGYVMKDADKLEIIAAIRKVHNGENYFSKSASHVLINQLYNPKKKEEKIEDPNDISKREKEVLNLIAKGMSNKEIADKLFLSVRTVDAHRYNIMQKLEVKNTAELITKALKKKLIEIES